MSHWWFLGLSDYAFWGALETGFVYALVALGVYLSFRVLDFPDLTVDGSFPLGGAVCAVLLIQGWNPWAAMACAFFAGSVAGFVTAFIFVRFGILHLLASILTMTALYSVNLRINGAPNVSLLRVDTAVTPFLELGLTESQVRVLFVLLVAAGAVILLGLFLNSEYGLAMRATGANPRMARANGVKTGVQMLLGVAISNAFVALAGALYAQLNGAADVTSGVGTIVAGLAAVILGETLLPFRRVHLVLIACVVGSVVYRLAVTLALEYHPSWVYASDLSIITATLMLVALLLPRYWRKSFT
jgi:putative ABC transport system permease protein